MRNIGLLGINALAAVFGNVLQSGVAQEKTKVGSRTMRQLGISPSKGDEEMTYASGRISGNTVATDKRAARKARNVRRHKKAMRGRA